MKITILGSRKSWHLDDLRRAATGRHEITNASFADLRSAVDTEGRSVGAGEIGMNTADAVLIRSMPPGSLEQIIFRMDALRALEGAGTVVVNPALAVEAAVDKYLTTTRLAEAGLPVPRTIVCQTVADAHRAYQQLGGDVVIKPLFGSEGRGIVRVNDPELAARAFVLLFELRSVIYLQEFIAHEGFDVRVLIVGEDLFAIRRRSTGDWRTNIQRGARAERTGLSPQYEELARRSAAALGAPLAGVDLLPARDGQTFVIEVNAVPGWRALSGALETDIAAVVLQLLAQMRQARWAP